MYLDPSRESGLEQRRDRQGPRKEVEEIREAGGWGELVSKAALLDWI